MLDVNIQLVAKTGDALGRHDAALRGIRYHQQVLLVEVDEQATSG